MGKTLATTTARLEARLPAIQGRTLTDFVVAAAREAAVRAIEEVEIIRLSAQDQRLVAQAILNPPKPSPALRKAFQRRSKLFGPA